MQVYGLISSNRQSLVAVYKIERCRLVAYRHQKPQIARDITGRDSPIQSKQKTSAGLLKEESKKHGHLPQASADPHYCDLHHLCDRYGNPHS